MSIEKELEDIVHNYLNEKIKSIIKFDSSENNMFKVTTLRGNSYCIKKYCFNDNKEMLSIKTEQQKVAETLYDKGFNIVLPFKFNDDCFVTYDNAYYLIYNYYDLSTLEDKDLDYNKVKVLATTLAKIHKTNISSELKCTYKKISINIDAYLKKYIDLDYSLYELLKANKDCLSNLIDACNDALKLIKGGLKISHNDYKLKNMLWNKNKMYLLDFDACGYVLPTAALIESAFALCIFDGKINFQHFEKYIINYIEEYGAIQDDIELSMKLAMNGKLQWLEYIMGECSTKNQNRIIETKNMIKELVLYYNNMERICSYIV